MKRSSMHCNFSLKRDIIFCGNPGVGKSTMASNVSGKLFESGIEYGSGKTSRAQFWNDLSDNSLRYVDCPGLADILHAKQAAQEITNAFRDAANNDRRVIPVFVVTLEAGRIRPTDHVTINNVMGAIQFEHGRECPLNSHGVIINKCTLLDKKRFLDKGKCLLQAAFSSKSKLNKYPTAFVKFVPQIKELVDVENGKHDFKGLKKWIEQIPGVSGISSVSEIDTRTVDEHERALQTCFKKEYTELKEKLEEKNETLVKQFEDTKLHMRSEFKKNLERLAESMKAEQEQTLADMKEMYERKLKQVQEGREKAAAEFRKKTESQKAEMQKSSSEYKRKLEEAEQMRLNQEKEDRKLIDRLCFQNKEAVRKAQQDGEQMMKEEVGKLRARQKDAASGLQRLLDLVPVFGDVILRYSSGDTNYGPPQLMSELLG